MNIKIIALASAFVCLACGGGTPEAEAPEPGGVEGGGAVPDPDRRVTGMAVHARGHGGETTLEGGRVQVALLVQDAGPPAP